MPLLDLQVGLDLATRIAACGFAIAALELFAARSQFGRQGVFGVAAVSSFHRHLALLRAVDRRLEVIFGVQFAASAGLVVVGPFSPIGRVLLLLALASAVVARWRRLLGGDGAEQMGLIVFVAAGLAVIPWPSGDRIVLAVTFIAAQLSLSYVTAGVAKLVSSEWRGGRALPALLSTYNHGHPWAARILRDRPGLARMACWTVILFECLFPLLLFGPDWMVMLALVCGFGFHAACAVLMGLNSFLWSFPATYPCVIAAVAYWLR